MLLILTVAIFALSVAGYTMGRRRVVAMVNGQSKHLHSLPSYYGSFVALWCGLPALAVAAVWLAIEPGVVQSMLIASLPADLQQLPQDRLGLVLNDIRNLASGNITSGEPSAEIRAAAATLQRLQWYGSAAMLVAALAVALVGFGYGWRKLSPTMRARNSVERTVMVLLIISSSIAILTTIGIVASLLFESWRFFQKVPWYEFLFGLNWSPQTAIRADQVGASGSFGAVPLFAGTLLISLIAMSIAVPIGLLSAIYMAEYGPSRVRAFVKPALEILAGIPTVVYGFFAALTVAPLFRGFGESIGLDVASESALAAGVVMGVMIIPFISSLSDDVITAVPRSLREGSYGLGATKSETIRQVIIPAALPGIIGSILLAASRAIGETMIVVMAAGLAANLTANPFEAVTTVTVQIVTLLVGDQEFDSAKTLAAFALGLVLFIVTLGLNIIALGIVRRFREQYD